MWTRFCLFWSLLGVGFVAARPNCSNKRELEEGEEEVDSLEQFSSESFVQ